MMGERVMPWCVAVAAAVAVLSAIGPWPVGVFQDDGVYMVLAKSLATGEGYRYLNIPGSPNATHYPPAYPAFLAVLWKAFPAFPQNVALFKMANAAWLAGAATLWFRFARKQLALGAVTSGVSVALFTACAPVVLLSVMVLSEPMFLCLLALAVLTAERAASSGRVRDAALAGAAAVALSMVRTLGILVVPAALLVLAWRRQWRAGIVLGLVAVLGSIPWQWWVAAHAAEVPPVYLGKYGSYSGWLVDAVRQDGVVFLRDVAWTNLKNLVAQGWASTATDTLLAPVRHVTSVGLAFFFGMGLGALARKAPVTAWFLFGYLAVVVIWPFAPARFTWGVWPLVGLVYAMAMTAVWRWGREGGECEGEVVVRGALPSNSMPSGAEYTSIPARASSAAHLLRPVGVAALAALLTGYGGYNYLGVTRDWWTVVQKSVADRARPLAEWVVANTDSSAVIATDDDVLIHLYTGRRAIPNVAFTPQEHLRPQTPEFATQSLTSVLDTYQVDFVLASTEYGTFAVNGLLRARTPRIRILSTLPTGAAFATLPVAAAPRTADGRVDP